MPAGCRFSQLGLFRPFLASPFFEVPLRFGLVNTSFGYCSPFYLLREVAKIFTFPCSFPPPSGTELWEGVPSPPTFNEPAGELFIGRGFFWGLFPLFCSAFNGGFPHPPGPSLFPSSAGSVTFPPRAARSFPPPPKTFPLRRPPTGWTYFTFSHRLSGPCSNLRG